MIIEQNKKQTLKNAVITLFATALFFVFLIVDFRALPHKPSPLLDSVVLFWCFRVFCAMSMVVTLACTVYAIKELFSKEPLIEVCDDYLLDNSSAISLGKIRWDDMERVYIKNNFLNIKLKNPGVYFHDKNGLQMLLIKTNLKLGYGDVCISAQTLQKDAKAFFEEVNKRVTIEC